MTLETGTLAASVAMAAAAGVVGSFAVMRRMTLAADAISHVALPGIGIALALRINPLIGAAAMLFFGALLIWAVERRTRMAAETVIGVVFSTALAVGSLMSSGEDLIDALFGGPGKLGAGELAFGAAASVAVVLFILVQKDRLVLALVSPEIARTTGIDTARLELLFLETFALTIALGLRYLGVLLMGSLIIVPAATARRVSNSLSGMLVTAVAVAVLSTVAGTGLAFLLRRPPGPVIICAAGGLFLLSLLRRRT
ncbi:MAG TPA: metal ABC transporter permease [Thermoanaerobaculia bacterium]|jgi:zinc transport system permease protein|nr:metal ABC transporter permease [Thermoanaerobaculia bacterium]